MIRINLAVMVMPLVVVGMAHGADRSKPEVLVRVFGEGSVPGHTLIQAQTVATAILATAGVRLRWANLRSTPGAESRSGACGTSGSVQTIDLRYIYSTPPDHKRGALAEAFLFAQTGVHITVFFDRVARILEAYPNSPGRILGHVLAHETGHMLLRTGGHSEIGLMRERWDVYDFRVMEANTLRFTPENASLIRSNLAQACTPSADPEAAPANQ